MMPKNEDTQTRQACREPVRMRRLMLDYPQTQLGEASADVTASAEIRKTKREQNRISASRLNRSLITSAVTVPFLFEGGANRTRFRGEKGTIQKTRALRIAVSIGYLARGWSNLPKALMQYSRNAQIRRPS